MFDLINKTYTRVNIFYALFWMMFGSLLGGFNMYAIVIFFILTQIRPIDNIDLICESVVYFIFLLFGYTNSRFKESFREIPNFKDLLGYCQ